MKGKRESRGGFTDRWMDNVLKIPQETLLSSCVTTFITRPPFLFHLLSHFSFLSYFHSVFFSHLFILYLMTGTVISHLLFFLQITNSSSPLLFSLSPNLLFSLMDANVHHQQHPSVGDPFLHLLTEGHNRLAEIIHSFIPPIYEFIQFLPIIHSSIHSVITYELHLFDH